MGMTSSSSVRATGVEGFPHSVISMACSSSEMLDIGKPPWQDAVPATRLLC